MSHSNKRMEIPYIDRNDDMNAPHRSVEVRYLIDGEEVGHDHATLPDMPLAFEAISSTIEALVHAHLRGKSEARLDDFVAEVAAINGRLHASTQGVAVSAETLQAIDDLGALIRDRLAKELA